MKEPNFQEILKSKREYYGYTEAAIEFAAEEFNRKRRDYMEHICKTHALIKPGMVQKLELLLEDIGIMIQEGSWSQFVNDPHNYALMNKLYATFRSNSNNSEKQ